MGERERSKLEKEKVLCQETSMLAGPEMREHGVYEGVAFGLPVPETLEVNERS